MMLALTLLTALAEPLAADAVSDQYQDVTFVIAASEKSYSQAVLKAATLAEKSGILYSTNGINFDPQHKGDNGGLTYSKSECESNNWGYPCYVSRGRWDEGMYITVEYSSAIQGFTPGLYVVIAASGNKDTLVPSFNTVNHFVPDAYMKTASVYVGCMQ